MKSYALLIELQLVLIVNGVMHQTIWQ